MRVLSAVTDGMILSLLHVLHLEIPLPLSLPPFLPSLFSSFLLASLFQILFQWVLISKRQK